MRDRKRIPEVIRLLWNYWEQHPDMRLPQIIHAASCAERQGNTDPFYMEERDLLKWLDRQLQPAPTEPK